METGQTYTDGLAILEKASAARCSQSAMPGPLRNCGLGAVLASFSCDGTLSWGIMPSFLGVTIAER